MHTDDLFAEFETAAADHGWLRLSDERSLRMRQWRRGDVIVTVHANRPGTALVGATMRTDTVVSVPTKRLTSTDGHKRESVLHWLRKEA